ncbi:rRNA 2'-O-methyltransferase fibrillarin 2 [Linum perenne]
MVSNEKEDALRQIQALRRESSRRQRAAAPVSTRRKNRAAAQQISSLIQDQKPVYILFECALGYAIFYFHNIDQDGYNFESAIKHIQDYKHTEHYQHIFKLIPYYPFQSTAAALSQLRALYNSNPTKELIDFLVHNLPDPNTIGKFSISGVFIAKGKNNDAICTKNLVPGEAINGEELISVKNKDGIETEYRIWNPSRSKLAAAIQCVLKIFG